MKRSRYRYHLLSALWSSVFLCGFHSATARAGDGAVSFRRQVMGVLSTGGCNTGSCHGLPSGRGGFRLSLWGHDPAADYVQLTRDALGRRADRLHPDSSLVLLKALGLVAHEGGRRFAPESPEAGTLRAWLAQGLRDDPPDLPALTGLDVTPDARVLYDPERRQQLTVRARFADGSGGDVTRLTVFSSSDPAVARAGPTGLVEFNTAGEVAVLCRYLDQVRSVRLTCLKPRPGFRWPDAPENNDVDRHVFAKLKLLGIAPSDLCTDAEFVRRAYLDVCGRLPTPDETRAFVSSPDPGKRSRLTDTLLARPEYADFWALKWADILRVRKTNIQPHGVRIYHSWLRTAVRDDAPFDGLARALLTSQGHSYLDGPVNFYCVVREPKNAGDLVQHDLAETTSQVFLGVRMQCAKCHNHPFERWTQDDYHGLAAFFAQVKQHREGKHPGVGNPEHRPVSITLDPNAPPAVQPRTGKPVPARFLGGPAPDVARGQDPRAHLAAWLTRADNPFFARAVANRVWHHLMGRGIVDPVDDFRDSNPPVNDELLDALAREFVANGFRVKPLVRLVMNSRTYQLSTRPNESNKDDGKYFSHVYVKPLTAEVMLDALCDVTGVPEKYEGVPLGTRAVQLPDGEVITSPGRYLNYERHPFMKTFGQPAREVVCECARENEYTLAQALELMNGRTLTGKLTRPDNRLGRLLADKTLSDRQVLDELYLAALSRPPSDATAAAFLAHVARAADKRKAWEDVLWTLLRSNEFVYRH